MASCALFVRYYTPTFQETAHLIREGKDNEQPCELAELAIVHHPFLYLIHFLSTLALVALTFWKQEAEDSNIEVLSSCMASCALFVRYSYFSESCTTHTRREGQ